MLLPIETAPKDGTYILLFGPSGYSTTPLRCEVCNYDAEYRPRQPWINHANDSFTDGGEGPTHWMPLPEVTNNKPEFRMCHASIKTGIRCPHCFKLQLFDGDHRGQTITCPICGEPVSIV